MGKYTEMIENSAWTVEQGGNGWNEWDNLICPHCNEKFEHVDITKYNFCPNCGKDMRKVY